MKVIDSISKACKAVLDFLGKLLILPIRFYQKFISGDSLGGPVA